MERYYFSYTYLDTLLDLLVWVLFMNLSKGGRIVSFVQQPVNDGT